MIIPVFDEEGSLAVLHEQLTVVLKDLDGDYEIIFVDDGSRDGSFAIMEALHEEDPNVSVIRLRRNFGKSHALAAGFAAAVGEIIVTLDADLQDDPSEIPRFIEQIEAGSDLVTGWKYPRHDPITKTWPSLLFNFVLRTATGLRIHDFNCGFKAMRREIVEELKLYGELHRYIPALAKGRGFRVEELKVTHHPRRHGKSKYGFSRVFKGFFDFLTVSFLTRYDHRPLHFFGCCGALAGVAGVAINTYLTVLWFMGEKIGHRPLLTLGTLLIVVGMQLGLFGLLAEMLAFRTHAGEQSYSVRARLPKASGTDAEPIGPEQQ